MQKLENKMDTASDQVEVYVLHEMHKNKIGKNSQHNLQVQVQTNIENEVFEAESVTVWPKRGMIPG